MITNDFDRHSLALPQRVALPADDRARKSGAMIFERVIGS
jgi:hypothetical protein